MELFFDIACTAAVAVGIVLLCVLAYVYACNVSNRN